jgi:thymidine kinase
MAKLYFNYSSMNAGKSTSLLQAAYNYEERGMNTLLLIAALDDRAGKGRIASRIGLAADADIFSSADDVYAHVDAVRKEREIHAVLVDEAQFLTEEQVWQLARVADGLRIPVMCFGLRTDFQGKLFPGSAALAGYLRQSQGDQDDLLVWPQGDNGCPAGRRRQYR